MSHASKRTAEVRLLVIAWVDLGDPTLAETLTQNTSKARSIADIVSAEIVSNLESIAYIEDAVASQF